MVTKKFTVQVLFKGTIEVTAPKEKPESEIQKQLEQNFSLYPDVRLGNYAAHVPEEEGISGWDIPVKAERLRLEPKEKYQTEQLGVWIDGEPIENYGDRFFLEEIIRRLCNAPAKSPYGMSNQWATMNEYPKMLIADWMNEKIKAQPISEEYRLKIVEQYQGDQWQSFYFTSEAALAHALNPHQDEEE